MNKVTLGERVKGKMESFAKKKITFGFDGFSDTILKVVKSKDENNPSSHFTSIHEFGKYILAKGEKNFSLELEEVTTKIGGNMPIMANALAPFGAQQSCIGSLGFPEIHPVFSQMPSNCKFYSFADPGHAKAMEFNGKKIMLAEIGSLNRIEWDTIKETISERIMYSLFTKPDLVCLLNWSELDNSTEIWKGLLADILPKVPRGEKKPLGFFDLADCSKRNEKSICEAMELLKLFSRYWDVTLSLNLNEAMIVSSVLDSSNKNKKAIEDIGQNLYQQLSIDTVIIHYSKQSLAWNKSGLHKKNSFYISNPTLSTGAGDNFNAGFCAGMLMDLDTDASLVLGHAVSGFYMENGKSPTIQELLSFMSTKMPAVSILSHL